MKVINARNAHVALPRAIDLLQRSGVSRASRNGRVLVMPCPVSTVYTHPLERVVFWPARDYNAAFTLYEALWMLAGRNDCAPLKRYVSNFDKYSDDGGLTLHGAYGHRWRRSFGRDQLGVIAERLRSDPDDRRCVLQMWDARVDLGRVGNDVPCNTIATFQRSAAGALDMTVFCRSNDCIWGAYYANAVHFGFLLEYMAHWIGCAVGMYTQVSVNWHAYEETLRPVSRLSREVFGLYADPQPLVNPYAEQVRALPIGLPCEQIASVDEQIGILLLRADAGFDGLAPRAYSPFFEMAERVLHAHHIWRTLPAPERYDRAAAKVSVDAEHGIDWAVAALQWIERRRERWEEKMRRERIADDGPDYTQVEGAAV